jgi:hypothetical protein
MPSPYRSRLLAACCGAALLTACPGDDTVLEPEGTSTSTGDIPPTTLPTTGTDPTTTTDAVDTTVTPPDTTTTVDPDTTGSTSTTDDTDTTSSSSESSSSESSSSESSSESSSTGGGMNAEGYADCLADPAACLPGETCVVDDLVAPTISVCTDLACANANECPEAPAGGTAPVTCSDITGDMVGDCFLDCSGGLACPAGMTCFAGFLCAWPNVPPPAPEGYADCIADPVACLPDETCVVDDVIAPTISVCTDLDCASAAACPSPPPGGTAPVTCNDITGDAVGDCFLDCSAGQTCPTDMSCFAGFLCAWPTVPPVVQGFADCIADPTACLPEEVCIVDVVVAPTVSVCTDLDCLGPADCPVAPPGGTAPVGCLDITGDGTGDCFVDCSGGQTCPTGMTCFAGFVCAWPV